MLVLFYKDKNHILSISGYISSYINLYFLKLDIYFNII